MKTRVIIIGFGHHARRIYFPVLQSVKDVEVVGLVDLKNQSRRIDEYINTHKYKLPTLYIDESESSEKDLTEFCKKQRVDAVIISTDPESHVSLAQWAFSHGFHVMMDKPVHAEPNAAHDPAAARNIQNQYVELVADLKKARKKFPNLICEVLTQRRYHPVYTLMKETIAAAYQKAGCPITYYYSFHSDGQFRFPDEIRDMQYHGFTNGFGKASHSGYHFFDMLNWLSEPYRKDFSIDNVSCLAWGNYPTNYMEQVRPSSLSKLYADYQYDSSTQASNFDHYGEIDVMNRIQLKSNEDVITHAQIDLLHSGLSARSWGKIGNRDIYKGNGRVRHEQYYISMGPFLSISLTSWQGRAFNKESMREGSIFDPGHEFNVDLDIFRNKILGEKEIETYKLNDLYTPSLSDYSRGHQEDARRTGISEFFEMITSGVSDGRSSLTSHALSNQIMSVTYESLATRSEVTNKLSRI